MRHDCRLIPVDLPFPDLVKIQADYLLKRVYGVLRKGNRSAANESRSKECTITTDMEADVFGELFKEHLLPESSAESLDYGVRLTMSAEQFIAVFERYRTFKWY